MKIQLFDADDLKQFEDTLFRAMVRALRVATREGLISGHTAPQEAAPAPQATAAPSPAPAAPQPPPAPPRPVPAPTAESVFGRYMEREPDPPELPRAAPQAPPPPEKRTRRDVRDVCKTVAARPLGYITRDEAVKLIGGNNATQAAAAQVAVTNWVLSQEVPAVIVADGKNPPTKGLPGRLMIDKAALETRNRIRRANAALPTRQRHVPKRAEQQAQA